jgi:hypothetical protein
MDQITNRRTHLQFISATSQHQEMALHMQLVQVGSKKHLVIQDTTLEKNVPYSVFENKFFPYQTRYLTSE